MIDLSQILDATKVSIDLDAKSKRQALQMIAEQLASVSELDQDRVYRALMEREKLGTTGIGDGLAIPHAKFDEINQVFGFFARLNEPVDFDAMDEKPVDLLFVILAPSQSGAEHLKALARVARIFRDKALCEELRSVESVNEAVDALMKPVS